MMAEKRSQVSVVPQAAKGQTKANQVWHQLSIPQQQQILQRLIQSCLTMTERVVKAGEVAHEPLD